LHFVMRVVIEFMKFKDSLLHCSKQAVGRICHTCEYTVQCTRVV